MPQFNKHSGINVFDSLPHEVLWKILSLLDPADLSRVCLVSKKWHHFVINNGISGEKLLKKAPVVFATNAIIEKDDRTIIVDNQNARSFNVLRKCHPMYSALLHMLSKSLAHPKDMLDCVAAVTSTNQFPAESAVNLLLSKDVFSWGNSYWSSKGYSKPDMDDGVVFRLFTGVCIITEIGIKPFLVKSEFEEQVYPSEKVRFRLGHLRSRADYYQMNVHTFTYDQIEDQKYIWDYTSPEYPMQEVAEIQAFKLPEPMLCIGGFLLIEFLGKVRKKSSDGLYYICIGHVHVLGHSLWPAFEIHLGAAEYIFLKHRPDCISQVLQEIDKPEVIQLINLGEVKNQMNDGIVMAPWMHQVKDLIDLVAFESDDDDSDDEDDDEGDDGEIIV